MLEVKLSDAVEAHLHELARKSGRSTDEFVRAAIAEYMEDCEDYLAAAAAARDAAPHIDLNELSRKYGMEGQLRQESGEAVRKAAGSNKVADRKVSQDAGRRPGRSTRTRKSA